jgi:hypothetical protein
MLPNIAQYCHNIAQYHPISPKIAQYHKTSPNIILKTLTIWGEVREGVHVLIFTIKPIEFEG